ncbi:envelope stress response membrane protein PspC [Agaribacterium haliotis]|uniref:envelope stress response membrane protein PspC n=1 Tax=Agaribacterium haliotis TaxID=2013869 RepID=UPI000BB58451|nr:envelope stress response membrane protein PspC [Agaribacterium haliotis]
MSVNGGPRANGYGMNLYRNTQKNWLGGVCAGVADHFDIDANIVRVIFIAALVLTGSAAFWLYIIAWVVLAPRPRKAPQVEMEYDENERCYRKKNMFRYQASAPDRLHKAQQRLDRLAQRIANVEAYVTSNKYKLNKEFKDLGA